MTSVPYTPERVDEILNETRLDARRLHELWAGRLQAAAPATAEHHPPREQATPLSWVDRSVDLARRFVARALDGGEFLLACDSGREALKAHRGDADLSLSLAVALARVGSTDDARRIVKELEATPGLAGSKLCQALSLQGNIALDEASIETFPDGRAARLRSALDAYRRASLASPDEIAPRLQHAVAALLLRDEHLAEAHALARGVLDLIGQAEADGRADLNLAVERAMALAITGRRDEAKAIYRAAAAQASAAPHELGAVRKEARRLAQALDQPESYFDECFPPLQLTVFSGHMLDAPGRTAPRFPVEDGTRVRRLLRETIDALATRVVVSSAAAGADLIFLEEMLDRKKHDPGCAIHVVLPWSKEEFVRTSVEPCGAEWVGRFNEVLDRANSVIALGEHFAPATALGLEYANTVMSGIARFRARTLNLDLVALALWDGMPGAPGGTASFVNLWRSQAAPLRIVELSTPARTSEAGPGAIPPGQASASSDGGNTSGISALPAPSRRTLRQTIKTMLFADIVGYSKLPEERLPAFVSEFMGLVSRLVAESDYPPVSVNTWGDAIYFVFDTPRFAGQFALDLVDKIASTAWEQLGVFWEESVGGTLVRHPLSIRTGLHTGPVFVHFDPIVRRLGFTGAHVSRAARIEPVTEPGKIFASEAFAAYAAVDKVDEFVCDFVGTLALAKKYPGEFRLYRIRRVKSLPLDAIARAIHEEYYRAALRNDPNAPAKNPSLRSWEELPADLKASNREQAEDISEKLRLVGYEIQPLEDGTDATFEPSPDEVERLAIHEHERWCERQRRQGWIHGPRKDPDRKTHPCLVPWAQLPEIERRKDFDTVRNLPRLLALAGFRARRVVAPS